MSANATAVIETAAATGCGGAAAGDSAGAAPAAGPFGDLGYGPRIAALLPALHAGFGAFNRYAAGPALRLGLGRYLSNPLTGYMMLLRTTGRTSGLVREVPLGYAIVGDAVYCTAGFGPKTHWLQNLRAQPRVEVVLPDRSFSGVAEVVTDPEERRRALRPLAESMPFFYRLFAGVDPRRASDDELLRTHAAFPLVRIRPTGLAAGPNDNGGWAWAISTAAASIVAVGLFRAGRAALRGLVSRGTRSRETG